MRIPRLVAEIVVGTAVVLAACGCAGEGADPTASSTSTSTSTPPSTSSATSPASTPSPTPTPAPTPAPTPTPQAEPPYDPADMSTWEISYTGIGPVQLDRPVAEVLAEVAAGEESCRPGIASFFGSGVVGVGDGSDPPVIVVATTGPSTSIDITARPSTDAGIAPGSSLDELLTAYPDAEPFEDTNGRPGYRLTDGTSWIHFTSVDGQTITSIDVSRYPLNLKEYCG